MTRVARARWLAVLAAALFMLASLAMGAAATANAHAYLVSTDPANGATVDQAPTTVVVTLSESVSLPSGPSAVEVTDSSGLSVLAGTAEVSGATLVIPLRAGLAKDVYLVTWRLISADTHAVAGSIQFGVGVPAVAVVQPVPDDQVPAADLVVRSVIKAVVYAGLVASAGWLFASWVLSTTASVRVIRIGAAVAAVGTFAQVFTLPEIGAGYTSGLTEWLVVRLIALGALAWVPQRRAVSGAAAVLAVVVTTRVGHGATSTTAWVLTTVHAAAAVLWLAGLAVLVTGPLRRRLTDDDLGRVRRWSLLATASVAVLLGSGLWRAVMEVGFVAALPSTNYGRVLLLKSAAVLVALGAAATAAWWLRRHPAGGDGPAPGQTAALRTRMWFEAGGVTMATLLAVVLSNLTPATVAYRPAETRQTAVGPYRAEIRIDPSRTGTELVAVTLAPSDPSLPSPATLSGVLRHNSADAKNSIVPVRFPIRVTYPAPPGETPSVLFRSAAVSVASAGAWALDLTVAVDQWNEYVARVDYQVR